ncbi:DUF5839 family protein [Clostridium tarantellae]|uniref:Uncharacterized protein n=1 Tax=Clostridium tarantellae TaxID=39493 RepID=A0A6I1MP19_9CLOT|nr:DUF5839 family protein [Clostridium tarantellae]MPQ44523.1 hypothetical protein [Clostridium tarantellae]
MDDKQYRTLVVAMHFKIDENKMMVINPEPYTWTIGKKALKPGEVVEKGDIVFAKVKHRNNKITCKPVLVINVTQELITEDSKKHRDITRLIEKGNKKK